MADEVGDLITSLAKLEIRLEAGDRQVQQHIKFLERDIKDLSENITKLLGKTSEFDLINQRSEARADDSLKQMTRIEDKVDALGDKVDANTEWRKKFTNRAIGIGIGIGIGSSGLTAIVMQLIFGAG